MRDIVEKYLGEYLLYLPAEYANQDIWKSFILLPEGVVCMKYPTDNLEMFVFFHEIGHLVARETGNHSFEIGQTTREQIYADDWAIAQMKRNKLSIPKKIQKLVADRKASL